MRKKIIIRRVIQRPIRARTRSYYTPIRDLIMWESVPVWIQFLLILLIIGGIAGGIYFNVSSNYDYEESAEVIIINDRPWWNNW